MKKFVLVANSTTDETAEYYERNEIRCAALSFTIAGRTIKENFGRTMPFQEFFANLRAGNMSTTSQAQVEDYLNYFRAACAAGMDVLYVGFSSGLSGSYAAGCMAAAEVREQYPERTIRCVDTLSAAGGEAILVEKARQLRDAGCTADEAGDEIEKLRLHVIHLVTVDDLKHLWRGGRVSRTSAVVGGLIGIKPMIYLDDEGKLEVCGKMRGRRKALNELAEYTLREITDRDTPVRISHGDCEEDARYVAGKLEAAGLRTEIRMIDTVIGSHTGPGVMTAFFIGGKRAPF